MTSEIIPPEKASTSDLPTVTGPSSEMQPPSLKLGQADQHRLSLQAHETKQLRSALSFLQCVSAHPKDFADMKAFEKANSVRYLGFFNGFVQYMPLGITTDQMSLAVDHVQSSTVHSDALKSAIYELWLTTKHEKLSEDDKAALLGIYFNKLKMYPTASVQIVMREFGDKSHFFPSWAEIKTELDTHSGWRIQLVNALRRIVKKPAP
jgi:hypothetical protein